MCKGITIVTCLYDLKKRENIPRRSIEEYLKHGENVCSIDQNMIIFAEEEMIEPITNMRKKYGLLNKTKIICKDYQDLPYHHYLDLIKRLHQNNKIGNMNPRSEEHTSELQSRG